MEIEARYVVPNRATRRWLRSLRRLGEYTLFPQNDVRIADHYVDTADRSLLRRSWACRLRCTDGAWSVTLKGPAEIEGDIMTRTELQVPAATPSLDTSSWPEGDLRRLVDGLAEGAPLEELVVIVQRRTPMVVREGHREVCELALDRVTVRAEGVRHRSHLLECELSGDGELADLQHFTALLRQGYRLIPEPRTKLQLALECIELARRAQGGQHPLIAPEDLAVLYGVDVDSARNRAELAEVLFNGLSGRHRLAPWNRTLVRTAALLCEVGRVIDYRRPARAGRDVLLHQPLQGLDDEDRCIIAAAAYLHAGKVSRKRLRKAIPQRFPPERRQEALLLAAVVRMACALTVTPGEQTAVQRITEDGGRVCITLCGPRAQKDARRARKRSGLWTRLLTDRPRWQAVVIPSERRVGIRRGDTMQQAAAKVLEFHTDHMLAHEAGTREGSDPEDLHDMRVSVRRLRSALRLFEPYLRGDGIAPIVTGLREAARVLGAVRDLDVGIDQARVYAEQRDGASGHGMSALISEWDRLRQARRADMIAYLDGVAYRELVGGLQALIALQRQSSGNGEPPPTVAQTAGAYVCVYWNTVLAYGDVIPSAPIPLLHALRIDCKRLRYAIEFFEEVLAPEATSVLREVVRMQDHLGSMHDAAVTADRLAAFLERRGASGAGDLSGVSEYLTDRRTFVAEAHQATPKAWKRLTRKRVRRTVQRVVA